mmetsp:Transcript_13918/g.35018  ORF Transcript_13918/g.35018 Transcript_13918/m.35018 type:complete len:215 (-) Transcript_13918:810-1454(-)
MLHLAQVCFRLIVQYRDEVVGDASKAQRMQPGLQDVAAVPPAYGHVLADHHAIGESQHDLPTLCYLRQLPHHGGHRVAVVLAGRVRDVLAAVVRQLRQLPLARALAVVVLHKVEQLEARVGEPGPAVRHRAQDGLAVVAAGHLAVVPRVQLRGIQPVVMLRDEDLGELLRVAVEVLGLMAPPLAARAPIKAVVGKVARCVHPFAIPCRVRIACS